MKNTSIKYDISMGTVSTTRTGDVLAKSRVGQLVDAIYDEFSGDAPIQQQLVEFSAWHQNNETSMPDFIALKRFDYLENTSSIRTKGLIALNMVYAEVDDGELSAYLVKPFNNMIILPTLYERWRAKRSGGAIPPLCL